MLTNIGTLLARPVAFLGLLVYAVLWMVLDRASFDWHAAATLVTLAMTLFMQRSEHRDTQAIHAKLDELLRVNGDARTSLTRLDDQEPEQIERHRAAAREGE